MSDPLDDKMSAFQALPREQKMQKMQMLDDDTRQAFVQTYNGWKAHSQNKRSLEQAEFKVRASDPSKGQFWSGVVQKASMGMVPLAADKLKGLVDGQQSRQYRDYYKKAADASTGAQIGGSILNPTNLIGGGVAAQAALAAGQSGLQDATGGRSIDFSVAAQNAGGALVGGSLMNAASGGLTRFQNMLAGKLGPAGLKMVKDLARGIMMKGTSVAPQAAIALQKPGTSRLGLQSAQDDAVYAVINEINPRLADSHGDIAAKTASNLQSASDKIGSVMDPVRNIPIDTSAAQKDMFNMSQAAGIQGRQGPQTQRFLQDAAQTYLQPRADSQQAGIQTYGDKYQLSGKRTGPQGPVNKPPVQDPPVVVDASGNVIKRPARAESTQFVDQLPQQAVQNGQLVAPRDESNTVPLGVIDEMSKGIQSTMYNPQASQKLGIVQPIASGSRANRLLQDYIGSYMDPESRQVFSQGNAQFQRTKNAQNYMAPGLNKTGQGSVISTNPVTRAMSSSFGKARVAMFQGTKSVAEYAVNRLNNKLPASQAGSGDLQSNKIIGQMSPFQAQQVRRKFQTLAQMDERAAAAYSYAQSLVDPVFKNLFTAFSNDRQKGSQKR